MNVIILVARTYKERTDKDESMSNIIYNKI